MSFSWGTGLSSSLLDHEPFSLWVLVTNRSPVNTTGLTLIRAISTRLIVPHMVDLFRSHRFSRRCFFVSWRLGHRLWFLSEIWNMQSINPIPSNNPLVPNVKHKGSYWYCMLSDWSSLQFLATPCKKSSISKGGLHIGKENPELSNPPPPFSLGF